MDVIGLDLRGESPLPVSPDATSCAVRCHEWNVHAQELDRGRREDLTTLMGMVHEAMTALGSEMSFLHDDLSCSTTRFDEIVAIADPEALRAHLVAEVRTLKQVAVDRRDRWEAISRQHIERVSALEQQLQHTRTEALTDALTGIANRRAFERQLRRRMQSARERFVLAMIDLDDFKGINDRFGHAAGDQVLVSVARVLTHAVRSRDMVARLGGDEFAVIADNVTLSQAESRFSALVRTIGDAMRTSRIGDATVTWPTTISCGLAEFSAGDTEGSLLERADAALYDAKRTGKRRVTTREQALMRDLLQKTPR